MSFGHSIYCDQSNQTNLKLYLPIINEDKLISYYNLIRIMNKTYVEITSSVGAVAVFIILIVIVNTTFSAYAAYGNVVILLIFVISVGLIGLKLAEISN